MLKYSCTNSRLANWVLRHLSDQPGFIFPKRKGWKANLKFHYVGDQENPYFIISVFNEKELIIFIPLNNKAEKAHLKCVTSKKFLQLIKNETETRIESFQIVYLTCEKHEQQVSKILKQINAQYHLLMLNYEKMFFVHGNFQNPRLEFRLSSQKFDTDLIPNLLLEDQQLVNDEVTNSLFYQNLFFNLNSCWLSGTSTIPIRGLLKKSIPYWKQYRKRDQHALIGQISENLKTVFKLFFPDQFKIKSQNKKANECLEALIVFPKIPLGKKELNGWQKKQDQALGFLKDEGKQISIDSLALE